jgi:hypothetical protein
MRARRNRGERVVGEDHRRRAALRSKYVRAKSRAGIAFPASAGENQLRLQLDAAIGETRHAADQAMLGIE